MIASEAAVDFGVDYLPSSHVFGWSGFSTAEFGADRGSFRWTNGRRASLDMFVAGAQQDLTLFITAFALGHQVINIFVNGDQLFSGVVGPASQVISIPLHVLKSGYNKIDLDLPDARSPGGGDDRLLGLGIQSIRIERHISQDAARPNRVGTRL
jgi:hypothetical protein